ncbi:hypothetical protein GQ457_06G013440 [Hibiscus cannabinus]
MAAKGNTENSNQVPGTGFDSDEVVVLDEDCTVDQSGKYPTIHFSDRVHDKVDWSMRHTIIVRLLGRSIGYKVLLDRIYGLWHPRGELQLIDLENNYYLVRFEDERDYADVLINRPWTIFGSYLTVQPWSRSFSTDEKYPSNIVVWVRLPGLPYRYYCKALFRRIAQLVGRVIKVDYNTKAGERGKFARLAIMVDLNKPLRSCIGIDNFVQKIEYESLQHICYSCGKYGHVEDIYATVSSSQEAPRSDVAALAPNRSADVSNNSLYGPWMIANTRRRRASKVANPETSTAAAQNQFWGSRFDALHMEEDMDAADGRRVHDPSVILPPRAEASQGQHRSGARLEGTVERQTISKNVAYLASNPERKSKKVATTKDITGDMNVIPSSSEHVASIIHHNVQRGSNNHNAILIVEPGYEANNGSHSRSGKGRGKGSKGPGEIQRKGFKLHRQAETKSAGNRVPSSWVKEFADQIDVLAANENVPPDVSVNRDRVANDMDYSSNDGDDFVDSSLEKLKDGDAASSTFHRIFNFLVHEYNPEVVALFEPRVFGKAVDRVIHRFGFAHSFRVESHGFSGGLWILWKENIALEIVDVSNQFINGRFRHEEARNWIQFSAVYASSNGSKRKFLWDQLASLDPGEAIPWILGGNFNVILDGEERVAGSDSVSGGSRRFGEFIQSNGLVDLGFQGPPFTWSRGNLKQRLDRCLANVVWCNEFPNSRVIHLERRGSDHRPLLLRLRPDLVRKGHRPFRYIASWQEHADFKSILKDNWKDDVFVGDNISSLEPVFSKWNVEVFGHIGHKKRRLLARLRGIDNALARAHSDFLVSLADQLQTELLQVLEQEESFWQQKACAKWILYGDRNTKYYHGLTMNRRCKNHISSLKRSDGRICTDQDELSDMAYKFYKDLFSSSGTLVPNVGGCGRFRTLSLTDMNSLSREANADAGCRLADESAKCGGVIRSHDGRWVQGVAKFIGICSVLEAELWGAFTILHAAWGLGITRIVIELDCLEAVRMIKLASLPPGSPTILFHLRELLSRPWCVEVFHIDREKNRLAHDLAKLASGPSLCPIYFLYPPVPNYYSEYAITIG